MTSSDEVSAFVPVGDVLCQGDIVDSVPYGLVESPLTICRPLDAASPTGRSNYGPIATAKRPPAFNKDRSELVHARAWAGRGIVLWHGEPVNAGLGQVLPQHFHHRAFVGHVRVWQQPLREHDPVQETPYEQDTSAQQAPYFAGIYLNQYDIVTYDFRFKPIMIIR